MKTIGRIRRFGFLKLDLNSENQTTDSILVEKIFRSFFMYKLYTNKGTLKVFSVKDLNEEEIKSRVKPAQPGDGSAEPIKPGDGGAKPAQPGDGK